MVLHVTIGTVDPFVLLVDVWDSRLDPLHVLVGFVLRKFAGILVHWTLAVGRLWEEELWIHVRITKISPGSRCLHWISLALFAGDLSLLSLFALP